eukprot:338558-Pelagomonas_calceolata.AAC.5
MHWGKSEAPNIDSTCKVKAVATCPQHEPPLLSKHSNQWLNFVSSLLPLCCHEGESKTVDRESMARATIKSAMPLSTPLKKGSSAFGLTLDDTGVSQTNASSTAAPQKPSFGMEGLGPEVGLQAQGQQRKETGLKQGWGLSEEVPGQQRQGWGMDQGNLPQGPTPVAAFGL